MRNCKSWIVAFVLLSLVISGCDEEKYTTSSIPSGQWEAASYENVELAGILLTIDRDEETGLFVFTNGDETPFQIESFDESEWMRECYTEESYVLTEFVSTDLESITLAEHEISSPQIQAGCGVHSSLTVFSKDNPSLSVLFIPASE